MNVMRYDEKKVVDVLGAGFRLIEARHENHVTPYSAVQDFMYFVLERV